MAGIIKAFATDLDGTLTHGDGVAPETLDALQDARASGIATILVTGRITDDLDDHFPGLRQAFDAVVTENGAVLETPETMTQLAPEVDHELEARARSLGIDLRAGRSVIECSAHHATACLDLISELGVDAQLLRNRDRLMILPAGVSKRSGLLSALHELGLSPHNVLAVGDAENDLALLDTAEIAVAVANAVPSVKDHADLVLDEEDGAGVVSLLRGPLLRGGHLVPSSRHDVVIGTHADGSPVRVPATLANVLVRGESGSGKSHLAGLLAEQWVRAGYTVLVIDVEGDYHGLEHLVDVVVLEGSPPPESHELLRLLRQRSISVVLDLSLMNQDEATDYLRHLAGIIDAERSAWGLPHWVVIDEAHTPLGLGGAMEGLLRPGDEGYCLVTYRPEDLPEAVLRDMDVVITTRAGGRTDRRTALVRRAGGSERSFTVAGRRTPHVRHWHKYLGAPLPREHWFRFVDERGTIIATAENVETFLRTIELLDPAVLDGHLARGDISRWLAGCLQDHRLATEATAIERDVLAQRAQDVKRARGRLIAAIESVYGTPDEPGD